MGATGCSALLIHDQILDDRKNHAVDLSIRHTILCCLHRLSACYLGWSSWQLDDRVDRGMIKSCSATFVYRRIWNWVESASSSSRNACYLWKPEQGAISYQPRWPDTVAIIDGDLDLWHARKGPSCSLDVVLFICELRSICNVHDCADGWCRTDLVLC